ncbi:uncharacterized protein LY89DRAFT_177406 [Mollisia scopiformis]|uniref:N-acetyltransferase domain-containing protein n=1 Tax=Mollisia scopiformis TaxID=149040 RepID=A0A194XT88_MOLSC|nr:uncharacterized protein LY89DRAFT_177406 [Mollisia scopiformis]KUJ23264.1 hypothetical protein LY89DRAFT_177406 [Mollisia scopiformis]
MANYAAESERLRLQALSEEHLHDYHAIESNEYSMIWSTTIHFAANPRQTPRPTSGRRVLVPTLGDHSEEQREPETQNDWHRQHCYMSEALRMFLDMFWAAEENKKYDKLFAKADPENLASMNVLQKAGFKKGLLFKDGYSRASLRDKKLKSDLQGFYVPRPGTEATHSDSDEAEGATLCV